MNIFAEIKDRVSAKDIAYRYLGNPHKRIGDKLWYPSPFRQEKIPSFVVSDSFHDFGENWHGDGVDLVGRLYNMKPADAAKMIAKDFGIAYENEYESEYIIKLRKKEREERENAKRMLEEWFNDTYDGLCDIYDMYRLAEKVLEKKIVAKCLLQSDIDRLEYVMDKFISAKTTEDKLEIYKNREEIDKWMRLRVL